MVDLPPHRPRLSDHGIGQVVRLGGRGVHDDGQRGLQRMGEVAGVAPRFLGLTFVVFDQRVQFLDHRTDLVGHRVRYASGLAGTHPRDLGADLAQRPEPVKGLQRCQRDQPEPEQGEGTDQRTPQHRDLAVEPVAALRDLEPPADRRSRQLHVALDDTQLLGPELVAVVTVDRAVGVRRTVGELAIP